jgi:hypothetical protein
MKPSKVLINLGFHLIMEDLGPAAMNLINDDYKSRKDTIILIYR